jgi:predicted nuclease with TOPRIM domain
MAVSYADQLAQLEAEYDRVYDRIERSGGVDYRGELAALTKQIEQVRRTMEKFNRMRAAVESTDPKQTARMIVETLIDYGEDAEEIAADFIENEIGRLDWVNNWSVIRKTRDPVAMVQDYLTRYNLAGNAQEIVNIIDQMSARNPGRWK